MTRPIPFDTSGQDQEIVSWQESTAGRHGVTEEEARHVVDQANSFERKKGKAGQPKEMWLVHGRAPSKDDELGRILEVGLVPEWAEGVDDQTSDPVRYHIVHAMDERSQLWRNRILMQEQGHL